MDFYEELLKARKENKTYATATVVKTERSTPRSAGSKILVLSDGSAVGTVGGGVVEATVKGDHTVLAVNIKPEVIDPDDAEMLGDLVAAAVNDGIRRAAEESESEMGKLTGGLNMPGFF